MQDSLVTGRFGERMRPAMGNSFMQKFMLMVVAGLVAAGMIYVFRHIVEQAIWESGDGWQESMQKRPKVHKY